MKIIEIKAIQDLANCVGTDGCYFICLCAVAEKITGKEIDVLRSAWKAIELKLIDYDLKRPRAYANKMFVFDADKLLKMLGCEGYYIEKVDELPKGYDGQYIIRYTLEGVTHFVLPDYNSLTYSNTVANGRKSKYYLVKKR